MENYEIRKDNLNEFYDKISVGTFPFISKSRVTLLQQGLYKKLNSNYHGVTMRNYNDKISCYLMGYYYVPENYIVVPNMELNDKHLKLIKDYIKKSYKLINTPPSLVFYEFTDDTEEWEVAEHFYNNYNKIKNGKFNNKPSEFV
jgi:hypothetical protein